MENGNGKGLFYGVIGVATLIVAIIGATFAYFTASASDAEVVAGTAAQAGLELTVSLVSADATGNMVPQSAATIQTAVTGTTNKSCIDANGNTVCKVYHIAIKNTGSAASVLYGTFTLSGGTFGNLKWGRGTNGTTGFGTTVASSDTDLIGPGVAEAQSVTIEAAATVDYYVVVFIDEIGTSQNDTDTGSFIGTVAFNSAEGSGVTSTFVA